MIVTILTGPRSGERFLMPIDNFKEGAAFTYRDGVNYTLIRNPHTGQWGATTIK
jgi:hypothetical protein